MSGTRTPFPQLREANDPVRERGIALVAALLVVLLSTMLVALVALTTRNDRGRAAGVALAKAALYAADAGARTEQQDLANRISAKLDSCCAAYSGSGPVITDPQALFPGGAYTVASVNPPFSASGTIAFRDSSLTPTTQTYDFAFAIRSIGTDGAAAARRVQSQGVLRVRVRRGSFADYLVFANAHTLANGRSAWFSSGTTFDGPVRTNSRFNFAFRPTFEDVVTSHDPDAEYNNAGRPVALNADGNGATDAPRLLAGFQRGQPVVPLPAGASGPQAFALTGLPSSGPMSNSRIRAVLWLAGEGESTPHAGVYVPHDASRHAVAGIYVQGDLAQLKLWVDTSTNRQWMALTQGVTVRTIEVDATAGTVKVWYGASSAGSPNESYTSLAGGAPPLDGVLYVSGAIGDLRGPDRAGEAIPPALAQGTQLLIAASGDIVLQRDLTLDRFEAASNVLGLLSADGSVRIGSGAPDDLHVDAFVMATGPSGEFAVDGYDQGAPRGVLHLRGGMVATYYGAFGTFDNTTGVYGTGYGRSFQFDRRGLVPPCFPTTNRFDHDAPVARTLSWKEI